MHRDAEVGGHVTDEPGSEAMEGSTIVTNSTTVCGRWAPFGLADLGRVSAARVLLRHSGRPDDAPMALSAAVEELTLMVTPQAVPS